MSLTHVMVFEPTCANCTVGSYASLSVCSLSVVCLDLTIKGENNSYLRKYWSLEHETLPQYTAFIGQYVKNMNYTLKNIWQVNMSFLVKILRNF